MIANILRPLLFGIIAGIAFSISMIGLALAQVDQSAAENTPAPVVVDISSDGTTLVRGTVTEVGPDSVTVESWGGTWTVRMTDDGVVTPSGGTTTEDTATGTNDLSGIVVGHFIGAEGMISSDTPFTIDASFMRNWTTNPLPGVFDTTTTSVQSSPTTSSPNEPDVPDIPDVPVPDVSY